jgi:hypothetical protein
VLWTDSAQKLLPLGGRVRVATAVLQHQKLSDADEWDNISEGSGIDFLNFDLIRSVFLCYLD